MPLYEAEIVADVDTRTIEVLTVNVTLVAPAGTVTVRGTLAAELLLESETCAPPAGAGPLSVTVPVDDCTPPTTLVGFKVSEETVGSGRGATVRVITVVRCNVPDVPVTVTLTLPRVAALLAVNVKVLVVVAGLGLKDALTPFGRPDEDKLTLPSKPFCGVMRIVVVPWLPWVTVRLLGEAVSA